MSKKKTCEDCVFLRDKGEPKPGWGYCALSSAKEFSQPACPDFERKYTPAITEEMLKSMALAMAAAAFYDKADWTVRNTPACEFLHVEKALKKWFKELGVEVKEK